MEPQRGGTLRKPTLLLCALLAALAAHAQNPTRTLIPENNAWRVHAGDDPTFASPALDDSTWTVVDFSEYFILTGPPAAGHARWIRKRITLPASPGPIDLLLVGDSNSFEVYVDGAHVGGSIGSRLNRRHQREMIFPLRTQPIPTRPQVEVAIRSHLSVGQYSRRLTFRSAAIGDPVAISTAATTHQALLIVGNIATLAVSFAALLFSFLLLSLFADQRGRREYLWLGLTVAFTALSLGLQRAETVGFLPGWMNCFLGAPALFFFVASELEFVYTFTGRTPGRLIRAYQAVLIAAPFLLQPLEWLGVTSVGTGLLVESAVIISGIVLAFPLLAAWYRRGSREAGILLLPVFLLNAATFAYDLELLIRFAHAGFAFKFPHIGLLVLSYQSLALILFLLTISCIIFLRFNRVSRDQAQAHAELESARIIQQFLVPEAIPTVPGLQIESVYRPAQSVGGDFFQIIPIEHFGTPTGATLFVIGDVSGKGLPAAMNVALIVGALRTLVETTDSPAAILDGLNRRLRGRSSGFTTCLVLRILPGGRLTLANAGHLNPYLSGAELPTDSSLPLGLDLDLETVYPETTLTLAPGDTLTLLTDGIIEARDPRTGDLFGFERTAAISSKSAPQIAAIAQQFGQEDDIAVLTLRYQPHLAESLGANPNASPTKKTASGPS